MEKSPNFSNLHCTLCNGVLELKYLNEYSKILVCSNEQVIIYINYFQCIFPFDSENIEKFIFKEGNINEFYQKIKKIFGISNTFSEETDFEEKNNNLNILNKGYENNNVSQNEMEESENLFSDDFY